MADFIAESEAEAKRGLAMEPDNVDLHFDYSNMLMQAGRIEEALREARAVRRLDPLSVGGIVLEQYAIEMLGKFDEVRAVTRGGLALDSTFVALYQNAGETEAFSGRADSALVLLKRGYDLQPTQFGNSPLLLFAYAVAGR